MTAEVVEAMETSHPVQAHRGPWTEEEYLALPEHEGQRLELIDGELYMSPVGELPHQNYGARLWRELDRLLPDELTPYHEANVRLRANRILIPDIVVAANPGEVGLVLNAAEVVLVGEVVSPTSKPRDRILKPSLFAAAGIEWYLRVEQAPVLTLVLQQRKDKAYLDHSRARPGEHLELPDLGCAIEVAALLRRRG